jgi:hypothetical protein
MIPLLADLILSGTIIALQPSTAPGAIAEVEMYNHAANGPHDEGSHTLTLDGLNVGISFDWDAEGKQADAITVMPPDGVLCEPASCVLMLDEGETGALILYEFVGF